MGKVLLEMSTSLDGYVTGADVTPEAPMGRGGELLHAWMFEGRPAAESQTFETEHFSSIGALIIGRRMADLGIGTWGERAHVPCPSLRGHPPARRDHRQGGRHVIRLRH